MGIIVFNFKAIVRMSLCPGAATTVPVAPRHLVVGACVGHWGGRPVSAQRASDRAPRKREEEGDYGLGALSPHVCSVRWKLFPLLIRAESSLKLRTDSGARGAWKHRRADLYTHGLQQKGRSPTGGWHAFSLWPAPTNSCTRQSKSRY